MALNFRIVLLMGVLGINTAQAYDATNDEINKKYLTLSTLKVTLVEKDVLNQEIETEMYGMKLGRGQGREIPGLPDPAGQSTLTQAGQVIAVAKDLVALGESVYALVIKGKPSNKTTYIPVSVLPRINNEAVDIFETEDWKAPRKFTYAITYTNKFNMDVVKFRYSVIYSYGGTYNGKGAYITAAQIIPERIMTSFGFDFSATMKVGGIQNHGKRDNPMAGLILTMQYTVETVLQASLESENYHIMGNGAFKKL